MLGSLVAWTLALPSSQSYRQRYPLPMATVPSGWGVNIHFNDPAPGEMERLAEAGFKWIRQDLSWHAVETRKGVYNFEPLGRLFDVCQKHGIRPLIILDYGNDLYQTGSPRTPQSRAAFCRMVEALVRRFKGRGAIWEMWNEPNIFFWQPKPNVEEYVQLALEVGKTIRRVAPEEYYVGPATSGFDWTFLERCFGAGLLRYWDAVTIHPYRQSEPETVLRDWGRLQGLINSAKPRGKVVPILSGEWGYSELYNGMDKERQAAFIARQYLTNLSAGVGLSIWYDWKDDGTDPKETEHHFGTVLPNLQPKPAYTSAKNLANDLRGYKFHLRLAQKSPEDVLMVFRSGKDMKYVAWTTRRMPSYVARPGGGAIRVSEFPLVFPVTKGPVADLLLAWSALPQTVTVGNEEDARAVTWRLRASVPKGARALLPKVVDDPATPEAPVRVRISKGSLSMEQEVLVLQTRPIGMNLLARGSSLSVLLDNPGGRAVEGSLIVSQGEKESAVAVKLEASTRTATHEIPVRPESGPISIALMTVSGKTVAQLRSIRITPVALSESSVGLVDEGEPTIKGSYRTTFEGEMRVTYDWPSGWKFVMLAPKRDSAGPLSGTPTNLTMEFWGDGSGDHLRMRFTDATGQTFQPDYGPIVWKGWRPISFRLDASTGGHWGGANDGVIHYPIRIGAIALVDSATRVASRGEFAVRNAAIVSK